MKRSDVVEDDGLRLLDVLLEEELAAQRPPAAVAVARGRSLAAAAWLLAGIAVVVGVRASMQREADRAASHGQDPIVAQQSAGSAELLDALRTPTGRRSLFDHLLCIRSECLGQIEADPSGRAPAEVLGVAELRDRDRIDRFSGWLDESLGTIDGVVGLAEAPRWSTRIWLEFDDGRRWPLLYHAQSQTVLLSVLRVLQVKDGPLAAELQTLQDSALAKAGAVHGVARSVRELAELPATIATLHCRALPAEALREHCARFVNLQELRIDDACDIFAGGGPPRRMDAWERAEERALTPASVQVIAALPTLRHLQLPGDTLDDAALTALGRMPALRSLTLTGSCAGISTFADLGDRLEVLRLPGSRQAPALRAQQLRGIETLPRLAELWLCVGDDEGAVAASLLAMPSLRRLAVSGRGVAILDRELFAAIAHTRVDRLWLTNMQPSVAALEQLAGLPSLREVDLFGATLGGEHVGPLGTWNQVTRLDLRGTGLGPLSVEDVRAALADSRAKGAAVPTVLGDASAEAGAWVASFPGLPTWTRP